MDVSVLMGANLAKEVASGAFCETTIGYNIEANGTLLQTVVDDLEIPSSASLQCPTSVFSY